MKEHFKRIMSEKSDDELISIGENIDSYQEVAYLCAIEELEKRNIISEQNSKNKEIIINDISIKKEKLETDKKEEKEWYSKIKASDPLILSKDYVYTPIIIYLNIIIYIFLIAKGVHPFEPTVDDMLYWGGNFSDITFQGQQWRLLTNIFIHGGLYHLVFNLYALLLIGELLEIKTNKHTYLLTYFISGLVASLGSALFNENVVSIGASGAIFGLYGFFLSQMLLKSIIIPDNLRNRLIISISIFIGYNIFNGIIAEGIDNAAHFMGLIAGVMIGLITSKYNKKEELDLEEISKVKPIE